MSSKDGVVHLWNLPADSVCVRLPPKLQKLMIEESVTIAKSRLNLSRILNINDGTIYDFEHNRFDSVSLNFVSKVSKFLENNGKSEFSLDNLETQLEIIKTKWIGTEIVKPKFPINFNSEEGAKIAAAILCDGGIDINYIPFYVSTDIEQINKLVNNLQKILGNIECPIRFIKKI